MDKDGASNGKVTNRLRESDMNDRPDEYDLIFEIIRERRSIRRYRLDVPDKDVIYKLIDSARYAPSATNLQPWLFLVITSGHVKQQMANAVLSKLKEERSGDEVVGGKKLNEFRRDYFLFFSRN